MKKKAKLKEPHLESEWIHVERYPVMEYECGLKAGDQLEAKQDIICVDDGRGIIEVFARAGDIWHVLSGAVESPGIVWLRRPDGERHTWDDEPGIFETFRRVERSRGKDDK